VIGVSRDPSISIINRKKLRFEIRRRSFSRLIIKAVYWATEALSKNKRYWSFSRSFDIVFPALAVADVLRECGISNVTLLLSKLAPFFPNQKYRTSGRNCKNAKERKFMRVLVRLALNHRRYNKYKRHLSL
jgi:hypothetical protein